VTVLIDGRHMCAMARGILDTHSIMKVNVLRGAFQKDQHLRNAFLARLS
jgi:GTP cyclohydrolase I